MTISNQTPSSGPYAGDGVSTAFSYNFLIDDEAEMEVIVRDSSGVETLLNIANSPTSISISGVGNNSGGTVTFLLAAPNANQVVTLRRRTVQQQTLDLQNRGSAVPQTIEDQLDELTKMVQDLQEEVSRCLKVPATTGPLDYDFVSTAPTTLPQPEADKVIGWNATADGFENKTV